MQFIPIKTRPVLPPQDDIYPILDQYLPKLQDKDILVVTSKILAIHQGRCIKIDPAFKKKDIIKKEAESWIAAQSPADREMFLTIKGKTLIPNAGIDESNSNGYYTLWPEKPNQASHKLWQYCRRRYHLKSFGVIITDSHTIPLRFGVMGISIGFWGFQPLRDLRGEKDIFGRKLQMTKVNIVDSLAAAAVFLMGEGAEQTPLLIIRRASGIKFTPKSTSRKLQIPAHIDLYGPLLRLLKKPHHG